jgi:hypothetical protein
MSVPQRDDLLTALLAVEGVADAEIVPDPVPASGPDDAGTLRLTLLPGADEVFVATAVNRILTEEFGLGLDAARVQVVEESLPTSRPTEPRSRRLAAVPTFTTEVPVYARGGRLLIQRMQVVSTGSGITTAVTLSLGGEPIVGEAAEPDGPAAAYNSVADATLRAVEVVVNGRARLVLEVVDIAKLGTDQVALVAVTMTSTLGTERLVGSSAVREDVRRAVIRATLDALNRRVEHMVS